MSIVEANELPGILMDDIFVDEEGGGDPEVGPEEDDDADLVDDGDDSSATRYPPKIVLLHLQLHSMLKGGPIRTALVIAAQLLGVDPAPVRNPLQFKSPH